MSEILRTFAEETMQYIETWDDFWNCLRKSEWFNENGLRHRDSDLPAIISYYNNGEIDYMDFYQHGMRHRDEDLPAFVIYNRDGSIAREAWWTHGKLFRFPMNGEMLPNMVIYENGKIICEWWANGKKVKSKIISK